MTLDENKIQQLADHLEAAELDKNPVTKITDDHPDMDWEDAYAIQDALKQNKINKGHRIAGLKMGLTSKAKMKQMGVDTPICGFMCDYGSYADGAAIATENFIHPRVEAEVAVVTKTSLTGPDCNVAKVLAAIDYVVAAVEIIDSRYENFRFDLKSVIADNTSASGFVVGSTIRQIEELDLPTLGVVLEKNGDIAEVGAGAAVLGDPIESIVMLANMLAGKDREIPAGTFIMTGGITAAVDVAAGDNIGVRYQDLGSMSMRFV